MIRLARRSFGLTVFISRDICMSAELLARTYLDSNLVNKLLFSPGIRRNRVRVSGHNVPLLTAIWSAPLPCRGGGELEEEVRGNRTVNQNKRSTFWLDVSVFSKGISSYLITAAQEQHADTELST